MINRFETTTCHLCGADDYIVLSTRARWHQQMRNVMCRRCGFVYANPRMDRETLDRFYRDRIYPEFVGPDGCFTERLIEASVKQADQTFRFFGHRAGVPFAGRELLEIGPGLGDFLVLARKKGAQVLGVEMDGLYADFAERERHLPIIRTHVEALEIGRRFDLIAMFHVLEHIEDPSALLLMLRERLHPGGHLLIEVPNFMGPWRTLPSAQFFRQEHLSNFSFQTLTAMLQKAGYRVVAHDPDPYFLRVVAAIEPAVPAGVNLTSLEGHPAAVLRHVRRWRVRAWVFAPYYAVRRMIFG